MSVIRGLSKTVFAAGDRFVRSPAGPRILIYHQVGTQHGHQMEVTLDAFTNQIAWLAAEREVVDLETALRRWDEPDSDRLVVLTFDDGYLDVFTTAYPILARHAMPFVLYISTSLIGESAELDSADPPLSWRHVQEMADSGLLTLGAHTHNHPDLRALSADEVSGELDESDRIISKRLGERPKHFAYPYGFWAETADGPVRERYETAVLGGSPRPSASPDPHLLHRYPVQLADGFTFFKARIEGGLRLEESVRRWVKRYDGP